MSKGGQNQALSNEENILSQINQVVGQWNQQYQNLGLPALQTLFPELMNTAQGKGSPLTTAAEAPVRAATQNALKSAQQQAGGLANPDLLYENIGQQGAQQAGLAGDQAVLGSLGDLQNLIGGLQGMASSGTGLLPGVAGQYGNIAQMLNPWSAIASMVQAGAEAYGASQGMPTGGGSKSASVKPSTATTSALGPYQLGISAMGIPGWNQEGVQNLNVSRPTSSLSGAPSNAVSSTGGLGSMPFYGA